MSRCKELYESAKKIENGLLVIFRRMENCEYLDYLQVERLCQMNLRQLETLQNVQETLEIFAVEEFSGKEQDVWNEKAKEIKDIYSNLCVRGTQAKVIQLRFIQQRSKDDREKLFDGDEDAVKKRRKKFDPAAMEQETTNSLKKISNMVSDTVQTTQQSADVIKQSSEVIQQTYTRSKQFKHFMHQASEALSQWWRKANMEVIMHRASLIFFFSVVVLIIVRRIPVITMFKVLCWILYKFFALICMLLRAVHLNVSLCKNLGKEPSIGLENYNKTLYSQGASGKDVGGAEVEKLKLSTNTSTKKGTGDGVTGGDGSGSKGGFWKFWKFWESGDGNETVFFTDLEDIVGEH